MFRSISIFSLVVAFAAALSVSPSTAGERKAKAQAEPGGAHPSSGYYRKGPAVKGYSARRGGYSYDYAESVNTYGDSRSNYGSASSLRDPKLDRQTRSGPFDHGFFYDSAVSPRGGDAPYMN
jgi:hypothetical protein